MKHWSTTEEELERRRVLLRAAARGNTSAREELENEYHVRVYSTAERESYRPVDMGTQLPAAVQRKVEMVLCGEQPLS